MNDIKHLGPLDAPLWDDYYTLVQVYASAGDASARATRFAFSTGTPLACLAVVQSRHDGLYRVLVRE